MQLDHIRAGDAAQPTRVSLDLGVDKYEVEPLEIPCAELMHLCHARCCRLTFALSTKDLDEGVIRWDYGQPYLIRQRASDGYCVHCDPDKLTCSVHAHRPRVCRVYDCRDDKRIWIDYAQRIPQPPNDDAAKLDKPEAGFDLLDRARKRAAAAGVEKRAIGDTFADAGPTRGPIPR
jgi:Fe-S-cluster containining protein